MKIAEVSKRYGISADTLRYYERIGILQGIPRNASGIRDYNEANCKTVEFVKCMRDAGMSIEALTEYMDLFYRGDETMERRKAILQNQREDIRRRIVELEDALSRLDYKIDHYEDVMEHERDIRK